MAPYIQFSSAYRSQKWIGSCKHKIGLYVFLRETSFSLVNNIEVLQSLTEYLQHRSTVVKAKSRHLFSANLSYLYTELHSTMLLEIKILSLTTMKTSNFKTQYGRLCSALLLSAAV